MKRILDLAQLSWQLSGSTPFSWQFSRSMETGIELPREVLPVPASVPGSVQKALLEAGTLPDWNLGLNARECEWVENRQWICSTWLPDDWIGDGDKHVRLRCDGLDYSGWVLLNGEQIGTFRGAFVPHEFDLAPHLQPTGNHLQIVFDMPPRWLGQLGYTSQMTEWKPRFNYGWDWTSRLVQLGIWDQITIEANDGRELRDFRCTTDVLESGAGVLCVRGDEAGGGDTTHVRLTLEQETKVVREEVLSLSQLRDSVRWDDLKIEPWQTNGRGAQPLYRVRAQLIGEGGEVLDEVARRVGFKRIEWRACEGAPPEAEPWICVVNGKPLFLQGVNWTPIRPNFADVTVEDYRQRLQLYRELGCNLLRVWGGAFLEKQEFYDLCDELGLLVWQEFPLSSSGVENWPPEEEQSIEELSQIARSYIARRQHHVSLLMWCGGNELQGALNGDKKGIGKPVDNSHPLMARFGQIVRQDDPTRRFVPTSSTGPRFTAEEKDFGKGLHHDVHGPWGLDEDEGCEGWERYWQNDDALFRSETGAPGASPTDIIRDYRGDLEVLPGSADNLLWRRSAWWIEWPQFVADHGREPRDLEEYVEWSQQRQAWALSVAARACKTRFPRCGGFLVWMGHDSFPCTANTAVIDFLGRPKPAALALAEVFHDKAGR